MFTTSSQDMTKSDLVLVGGGGHARACLDVIRAEGRFRVVGIVDKPELLGTTVLGVPVIGADEDLPALTARGLSFLVALGQIRTPEPRMRLYATLKQLGAALPTIVAPMAHVAPDAEVGEGSIVMHMAVIGPGSRVGVNCIVNSRALVEHDARVGDHCHIATGALVNGGCLVADEVFIGSGAVLRQGIRIGKRAVVGMGAVVAGDLADHEMLRSVARENGRS
jgi:sugar O-acyltransferase (sialic acid O-acetyltransferase NeuD family)